MRRPNRPDLTRSIWKLPYYMHPAPLWWAHTYNVRAYSILYPSSLSSSSHSRARTRTRILPHAWRSFMCLRKDFSFSLSLSFDVWTINLSSSLVSVFYSLTKWEQSSSYKLGDPCSLSEMASKQASSKPARQTVSSSITVKKARSNSSSRSSKKDGWFSPITSLLL